MSVGHRIPCSFPSYLPHFSQKIYVASEILWFKRQIPSTPCCIPCLVMKICGFWAQFEVFGLQKREIRCKIR